ncbi:MAG: HDIG domain-containing protein [bacterium]
METTSEKRSGAHIFGTWHRSDFLSWKAFLRSPALGWLLFLVGCFLITLLLSFQIETLPTNARVGWVAPKDIKADQNYEIIDQKSTQKNREDAIRGVLPVYDYDEAMGMEVDHRVQESFDKIRQTLAQHPQSSPTDLKSLFESSAGVGLSDDEAKALAAMKYKVDLEFLIRNLIRSEMVRPLVDDATTLRKYADHGVALRRVRAAPQENEGVERNLNGIRSLEEARTQLSEDVKKSWKDDSLKGIGPEAVSSIAGRFLRANVNFNVTETELRRAKAVTAVKPVIIKIQAGESIIRSGDRYDISHLVILQGIQRQKKQTNFVMKFAGTFLFVALLILVTYSFAARYIRKFNPSRLDVLFLGTNLIILLIFVRLFAALTSAFRDSLPFEIETQTLYYAIPVSAGAMMVRLILNSEVAIVFGVIASALAGLFLKGDADLSIFFLISSIAGAGSIAYADRRSAILKAGLYTGLINALAILTIKLVQVGSVTEHWGTWDLVTNVFFGFLGGTNSALYVLFYTPLAEMIFGYTTDIKLLELGNLNHPLMKQMIVKAPGTYHHSQLVAVLAEAAAESIGANPILARVGAYFHDIGKMKKPLYFIENQMGGDNRHDKLSPSMSALIISSHVKDGIELAEEYNMPKVIVDMIPQHQGTKLITYFYNKAKEAEQPDRHVVKEEDYRYPGPRPQTREAGILLLADGVEAAVRSLPEKSAAKIQAMVQKIINKSFAEEQLEECDLTLRDLRTIADSFVRVLIGIYHQRIEYPETQENTAIPVPIKKLEVVHSAAASQSPASPPENDSKKPSIEIKNSAS